MESPESSSGAHPSWDTSGAHPTHVDSLGRLRLTANNQLHFQSVMPYFLMLNKLGVLAFSLMAGCQVTGNPIPSTQHGSRIVQGFSGHLRCTPVLGRLRRTPNSRWFPRSPTPYGEQPAPLPVCHANSILHTASRACAAYPITHALSVLCEMLIALMICHCFSPMQSTNARTLKHQRME